MNLINCPGCQYPVSDEIAFCPKCGKRIAGRKELEGKKKKKDSLGQAIKGLAKAFFKS